MVSIPAVMANGLSAMKVLQHGGMPVNLMKKETQKKRQSSISGLINKQKLMCLNNQIRLATDEHNRSCLQRLQKKI